MVLSRISTAEDFFLKAVSVSVRQVIARRLEGGKSGVFVTSSPTSRESQLIHTPEFRLHTGEQDIAAAVKPPRSFLSQPIRRCPHQIRLLFLFLSLENSLNTFIFFHKYLFLLLLFKLQQPPPPPLFFFFFFFLFLFFFYFFFF